MTTSARWKNRERSDLPRLRPVRYAPLGCEWAERAGEGFEGAVETARACERTRRIFGVRLYCPTHGPLEDEA